jgi:hypothetical protein
MPGNLSDPEASSWPGHYDSKYDPGTSGDMSRPLSIEQVLQSISRSERGRPLTKEQLSEAQAYLLSKNMLNRNPGDQDVQETIHKYLQAKARKVASQWLTLIDNL